MLFAELLSKGGVIMFLIIILSIYVMTIIFYKLFQFTTIENLDDKFIDEIILACDDKQFAKAVAIVKKIRNPIARVLEQAIRSKANNNLSDDQKIRNMEAVGSRQVRYLDSHMRGLELVAAISPLLGLLGTVIGMVKSFSGIEQLGSKIDPSVLAGGIWEALLTTAAGLVVAIPALAAYHIIDSKVEHYRQLMNEAVSQIISG